MGASAATLPRSGVLQLAITGAAMLMHKHVNEDRSLQEMDHIARDGDIMGGVSGERDMVEVCVLPPERFEEAAAMFTHVWLNDNVLYSAANIRPQDFHPYLELLFKRAVSVPHSAAVAIDYSYDPPAGPSTNTSTSHTPRRVPAGQRGRGAIVSISFMQDLYGDVITDEEYSALPPRMHPILTFNDEFIACFKQNVLFQRVQRPGVVVYGLHGGTLPDFTNRPDEYGLTLSQRTSQFAMLQWAQRGYRAVVGVATHPETVRRYEVYLEEQKLLTVAIARKSISKWRYTGRALGVDAVSECPFASVRDPTHAVSCVTVLPGLEERVRELDAKL